MRHSDALPRRLLTGHLISLLLGSAPRLYLLGLVLGLGPAQLRWLFLGGLPALAVVDGLAVPRLLHRPLIERALSDGPGRLERLLELPRGLELSRLAALAAADLLLSAVACLTFGVGVAWAVPCAAVMTLASAWLFTPHILWMEQQVQPLAIEELHAAVEVRLAWRGLRWRRLHWHLPYALALALTWALLLPALVAWRKGGAAVERLRDELLARGLPEGVELLRRELSRLGAECAVALLLLGLFLVGCAVVFGRQLARQVAQGAEEVRRSIERMAAGDYRPPEWISTDELGGLAVSTARAFQRMDGLSRRLRTLAERLARAAARADEALRRPGELLQDEARLLEGAQVVARELKSARDLTAQQAEGLRAGGTRAGALRRSGEAAMVEGLGELSAIREEMAGMRQRIQVFGRESSRILAITQSVEGLATQSRMLALNARVEAARGGKAGAGFTEVAHQVREFAEQSLRAAHEVREILQGTLQEIERTEGLSRQSSRGVEAGLSRARALGESLSQLTGVVDESSEAARQIGAALAEQAEGVELLSRGVAGVAEATAEARERLGAARRVTREVDQTAREVERSLEVLAPEGRSSPALVPAAPGLDGRALAARLVRGQQLALLAGLVPLVYLTWLLLGLEPAQGWDAALTLLPPFSVVSGLIISRALCHHLVARALARVPGEAPGRRLARILELPRRQELLYLVARATAYAAFAFVCCLRYGRDPLLVLPCTGVLVLLSAFASVTHLFRAEALVRPFALEELRQDVGAQLPWRGPLWRGLRWYLPYLLGLSSSCALAVIAAVLWRNGGDAARRLAEAVAAQRGGAGALVREQMAALLADSVLTVTLLGLVLMLGAVLTAWRIARHLAVGAREVQGCIEALAAGRPRLPAWISTDELGELSVATAAVFHGLRRLARGLEDAAGRLGRAAVELSGGHAVLGESLSRQASSLEETRAIAQRIRRASLLALSRSEGILETVARGESIFQGGEAALRESLGGLSGIGGQAMALVGHVRGLSARVQRVGSIASMVAQLARESDTLALNACIQSMRSGVKGRTFGVVAKELRGLALRSGDATREVRGILAELDRALAATEASLLEGSRRVDASLTRLTASNEQLVQLAALLEEGRGVARQLASAIQRQHQRVEEIARAMAGGTALVRQLSERLSASAELARELDQIAAEVRAAAEEQELPSARSTERVAAPAEVFWSQEIVPP